MKKQRALLIGQSVELTMALPFLLHRAGFNIDVILNNFFLKKNRFIANYEVARNPENLLQKLSEKNLDAYNFIIVCDDATLKDILDSNLTIEQKLKLLPIKNEKNFEHIFSKIGLSKALSASGISTPPFAIANNFSEAAKEAEKIGYPLMLKVNSSNGGSGTFDCNDFSDLNLINPKIFNLPVLIQKKIIGTELDLSALYRDKKLIHFSYSTITKVINNKFGPSVVRSYKQLGNFDEKLFLEMEKLGEALGANGFTTISCIESHEDKKRYFFEADMRPNVWIDFSKFLGDDPAIKISKWFSDQEKMSHSHPLNHDYPHELLLPYFLRMTFKEILCNRYQVWKYMPLENLKLLPFLLYYKFQSNGFVQKVKNLSAKIKHVKRLPKIIKRSPTNLIRLAIPERQDRIKIRTTIKQPFQKTKILLVYTLKKYR